MIRNGHRRGVVLIDVILGIVLLLIAGTASVALIGQHFHSSEQTRAREREFVAASQQLERIAALWSRRAFEARRGLLTLGEFDGEVRGIAPSLFVVSVVDRRTRAVILSSTFYVTDTTDVVR